VFENLRKLPLPSAIPRAVSKSIISGLAYPTRELITTHRDVEASKEEGLLLPNTNVSVFFVLETHKKRSSLCTVTNSKKRENVLSKIFIPKLES
jgi:hypothetical protein